MSASREEAPHVGVILPNYGPALDAAELVGSTRAAEEAGFDSAWVTDHVLVPEEHARVYGTITEALVTLGYLLARTERIRLGVSALIVPQREPVLTLKQLLSLDYLSGGRVLTAVAAGWMEAEFTTLGASFDDRGRRLDAWLRFLEEAGAGAPGRVSVPGPPGAGGWLDPAPVRPEGVEVWVAGVSP
ncbi:MAG: LLM class flavin-dependent oxidoreductase, partial [Actinomycetota bacterium]